MLDLHKRKTADGYGCFYMDGKQYRAHCLSWEIYNNQSIPKDLECCHLCENKSCVNPDHLIVETHKWNMGDASRKGSMKTSIETRKKISHSLKTGTNRFTIKKKKKPVRGENNPNSKLSDKQRKEIYFLYHNEKIKSASRFNRYTNISLKTLAEKYNVTGATIFRIVNQDKWKDAEKS